MSWSSSYPPPRRSRSRSPSRGSFSGRPDTGYPQEYRDYDGYDRDRWQYERDRQPHDYGRRLRSRSPTSEDSRKRRRSPSPFERDRYDPRPRYNDDYDAHSRGYGHSPPRRGHQAYPQSRRAPPDPHAAEFPSSLKQYAEWFRYHYPQQAIDEDNADKAAEQAAGDGSKPRNGIKSKWEKYKRDFSAAQLQTMFDHHRQSPWFAEKYDPAPEFQLLRDRVRKEGWKGRLSMFLHDLESGKFDADLNEPTDIDEANVASPEERKISTGDDDMQFAMDTEDDVGDNDTRADTNGKNSSTKLPTNGDEAAALPEGNQVMIRTIPPDIGRVKLEEACKNIPGFVYLALGDPLQKRNYYRAGWVRFQDDADMEAVMEQLSEKKIEGFKLHVSRTTRPFVNKIRFAPEVASKPEQLVKDLARAKTLAALLEERAARLRKMKFVPEVKPEDNNTSDVKMEADTGEEEEPSERGSDAVDRRVEKIMADLREQNLVDLDDEKAYEAKKTVIALDLYIEYLRAAFHTCFYCCVVTDHLEELQRKCIKHVRKPLPKVKSSENEKVGKVKEEEEMTPGERDRDSRKDAHGKDNWRRNDDRWLEWLDSKLALLINRDGVDPREYCGKSYDEELAKAVEHQIKQEDEGKFRCKACLKLFKATSFVEKHIANKHPEHVKGLEDVPYFNNFALDPHRIQPFAHPPTPSGNSMQAPPQAYGIQNSGNRDPDRNGQSYYNSPSNGHWNDYQNMPPPRRDEATTARRLSDRITGPAESSIPAAAGLPAKPVSAMDAALSSGTGRRRAPQSGGPAPPPPPNAKEDPRAVAGKRISYHDMDLVAEGDVELFY
ncbi:hypothetical protein C8J56DRAFT_933757 [Mycena floridula]|nr:hypothetical protein C8J56DRAFT_933757 [Mycena floridula]